MKKIYLFCVETGLGSGLVNDSTVGGDVEGYALCEDGALLAKHTSSNKTFSKHDMGLTSDWNHDSYKEHCPEGFELEWVDDSRFVEAFGKYIKSKGGSIGHDT